VRVSGSTSSTSSSSNASRQPVSQCQSLGVRAQIPIMCHHMRHAEAHSRAFATAATACSATATSSVSPDASCLEISYHSLRLPLLPVVPPSALSACMRPLCGARMRAVLPVTRWLLVARRCTLQRWHMQRAARAKRCAYAQACAPGPPLVLQPCRLLVYAHCQASCQRNQVTLMAGSKSHQPRPPPCRNPPGACFRGH
jgi:hypothetical protein